MNNVTLSSTARTNLLSIQNTVSLIGRTQDRLSTGLAVKSPLDDAVKYFQAKSLSDRASDLSERKDGIDQGVSTLETVIKATDGMEKLVKQMKGIVDAAASQSKDDRKEAQIQLTELAKSDRTAGRRRQLQGSEPAEQYGFDTECPVQRKDRIEA